MIPEDWKQNKTVSELYIFTDGEINDQNEVVEPLKELTKNNIKIYIIRVEPNNINYLNSNINIGNNIYKVVQDNNLTSFVKRFSSHNEYHVLEPFISFDNPDIDEGCVPFQGKQFYADDLFDEFIEYIENMIKSSDKETIPKLAHDLSLSIHHITKNKTIPEKENINRIFTDLFSSADICPNMFNKIHKFLLIESEKHLQGKSSTYHEFKDAFVVKE